MFSRRTFVVTTGVGVVAGAFGLAQVANAQHTAAAAASVGSRAVVDPAVGATPAGMADMPDMPAMPGPTGATTTSRFHYGSHAITLTESPDVAALVIDGRRPIHLARPEAGKYYTHLLPFTMYDDSNVLVRDVLDCVRHELFVV